MRRGFYAISKFLALFCYVIYAVLLVGCNDAPEHSFDIEKTKESKEIRIFLNPVNHRKGYGKADCLQCHKINELKAYNHINYQPSQCMACHGGNGFKEDSEVLCNACHNAMPDQGRHSKHAEILYFLKKSRYVRFTDCEVCHQGGGIYSPTHPDDIMQVTFEENVGGAWDGRICTNISCHIHQEPSWIPDELYEPKPYPGYECIRCHRPAGSHRFDPNSGKHLQHHRADIRCQSCHEDTPSKHYNNILDNPDGIVPKGGKYLDSTPEGFNNEGISGSCSDMDSPCHGGQAKWSSEDSCQLCHGADAQNPPESGAHYIHASNRHRGYPCMTCHYGCDKGKKLYHLNGKADVILYPGLGKGFNNGKCAQIVCHGSGTPDWYYDANLSCNECHDALSDMMNSPFSGSHIEHINIDGIGCKTCHIEPGTHYNGRLDNAPIQLPSGIYRDETPNGGNPDGVSGYCASMDANCHTGASLWNTNKGCMNCHRASNADPPVTGAHIKHCSSEELNYPCSACHYGYEDAKPPDHLNGKVDVAMDPKYGGEYKDRTCSKVSCHGVGKPNWYLDSMLECMDCHRLGGNQLHSVSSGWHFSHIETYHIDCLRCHGSKESEHHNNVLDNPSGISFSEGGTYQDITPSGYRKTGISGLCSGLGSQCHLGRTLWCQGEACGQCHSTSHQEPMNTGSHRAHAERYGYSCPVCHSGFGGQIGSAHINGVAEVAFVGGELTAGGNYDGLTCYNLGCHGAGSQPLSGGSNNTPSWGQASTGTCGSCHGVDASSPPTTGQHQIHLQECRVCHFSRFTDSSNHINGVLDVRFDPDIAPDGVYQNGSTPNRGACYNISCHADMYWQP